MSWVQLSFLFFNFIFNVHGEMVLIFCVRSVSINFACLLNQRFSVLKCSPASMNGTNTPTLHKYTFSVVI